MTYITPYCLWSVKREDRLQRGKGGLGSQGTSWLSRRGKVETLSVWGIEMYDFILLFFRNKGDSTESIVTTFKSGRTQSRELRWCFTFGERYSPFLFNSVCVCLNILCLYLLPIPYPHTLPMSRSLFTGKCSETRTLSKSRLRPVDQVETRRIFGLGCSEKKYSTWRKRQLLFLRLRVSSKR